MKKPFALLLLITFFASILILPGSCKHEIPNPCFTNPVKLNITKTNAVANQNNGTIRAMAEGGEKFQYSLNGAAYQDSGYFTGIAGNLTYRVVARNSFGCTDTATVNIGSDNPCAGINVVVTATKTDASANQSNGAITVSATGGSGFSYSLDGISFESSGSFTNLAAGNYTVTAKNSNGCTGTTNVTIGTSNPCTGITIVVSTTKTDPSTNLSDGTITATATGSTGFTYSLNGGAYQSSGAFTGLAAGNYTVTAKNANGCTGVAQVALGASNPCSGVTITVNATTVNPASGQSNGSITVSATGATGFTYSLNNGAYQSGTSFTGLAAGNYSVTAKSSAGCLGTAQVTLTATNPCTNTNIVISNTTVAAVPCVSPANGSISASATGSSGYTFNVNSGAYQASGNFTGLAAGNYTVGVKDANGCTASASVTIPTAAAGPLYASVKSLLTTRCSGSGCHTNGGSAAGYNFDTDCNIISNWSQINSAAVTNGTMPKSPQSKLTTAEKQQITSWINAGHTYTN